MTTKKLRVLVLFGGRSGEHEVSLRSARSVLSQLDLQKYDVLPVGITHAGRWFAGEDVLAKFERREIAALTPVAFIPEPGDWTLYAWEPGKPLQVVQKVDLVFPLIHGTFGEDGTLQGLLELMEIPYVSCGVLASSAGMDKGVFKDVMIANNIPVVDTLVVLRAEIERDVMAVIKKAEMLSDYPLFTKPANLGSSVGVTKCNSRSDLQEGLMEAASFDRRVLVQKGVRNAREIEVSVLGNNEPIASVPGEVLPSREFYSYESKYIDGTSGLQIPAQLPDETAQQIREYAVRAYQAIDCAGMARVDFFVEKDTNRIYLNELNSLPGFTKISMYPKLWEASGLPYTTLIDRLIELAMERKAERDRTSHTYRSQP
jgi:D-alanine-D-alanine ligase